MAQQMPHESSGILQEEQQLWKALKEATPQPHQALLLQQVSVTFWNVCTRRPMLSSSNSIPLTTGIRLAGATSDVHIMDVRTGKWEKMAPHGEPPSPRAAHAAAAVGSMVVVQVGCVAMVTVTQCSMRCCIHC